MKKEMVNDKRKVATRTISKLEKIDKIKQELAKYPEGINPKTIAINTGIKQATVRGLIRNIDGVELVADIRGLYRLVDLGIHDSIFSYNFHNLIVGVFLPNYSGNDISQTLSCELTNYAFSICKGTKQATMRISSNYPINVSSITLIFALFKELVLKYSGVEITMDDVQVSSIEFNKDFINLKLEGVNCITLSNLIEQFKIYQKELSLRIEHKIKVPMNANQLIKLLGVKL